MSFYMVVIKKDDKKVTHCFESPHDALEWLGKGFLASTDDSDNIGVIYSIEEHETNKRP